MNQWKRINGSQTKDSATVSNTALSSGTYTATFEGKSVSLKAAYIVNGINATINGGTYKSTASDEAVFLVVNGARLTIKEATVDKTGEVSQAKQNAPNDDSGKYI